MQDAERVRFMADLLTSHAPTRLVNADDMLEDYNHMLKAFARGGGEPRMVQLVPADHAELRAVEVDAEEALDRTRLGTLPLRTVWMRMNEAFRRREATLHHPDVSFRAMYNHVTADGFTSELRYFNAPRVSESERP